MTVEELIERLQACPHKNTRVVVHDGDGNPVEVEWDLMGLSSTLFEYHIPVVGRDLEELFSASARLSVELDFCSDDWAMERDFNPKELFDLAQRVVDLVNKL